MRVVVKMFYSFIKLCVLGSTSVLILVLTMLEEHWQATVTCLARHLLLILAQGFCIESLSNQTRTPENEGKKFHSWHQMSKYEES